MEHESLEVASDQGDYIGAEEEKPRSQVQICWLSEINLCVILDLHASLLLVPVSDQLPSFINSSLHSVSDSYLFLATSQVLGFYNFMSRQL